ncbi:ROK family protein [Actinospica sp. MGRD01-02]|uniref:ROK family protein n=1 Tax=Actinospica acidithermotolerans TaxID=2828514 RepID=A0A941EA49_9ACTN|nr:ROK family protein [Actinospica acidithermotolerans]MBR7829040.1 ROK family protein [Actinospica acidithermotolerans]
MPQQLYAALDIGGTKIAAALVDAGGTLLTRAELPTPAKGSAEEVMAVVAALVETVARDPRWSETVGIGIGSAGPIDPVRGTVSPVNIPGWRDFPLVDHVRELDGVHGDVVLIGDGCAMAAGEHWRGAARGYDNALCLVVSTGVGAGLILDGALRTGPSGNAGHLGHISVDIEGEDCPCGSRGCVEIIASGTSIARWAASNGWRPTDNVVESAAAVALPTARDLAASARIGEVAASPTARDLAASLAANDLAVSLTSRDLAASPTANDLAASAGNAEFAASPAARDLAASARAAEVAAPRTATAVAPPTAADVAASARAGDEIALAAFERAGRALAAGIACAAMLVDIRAAVIGGGVAKAGPLLLDPLRRHLTTYASLPFTRDLAILPATLGADAGLIGAAAALAERERGRGGVL